MEIVSRVQQARQYMDAARSAGDLTRPLLLYYSVLSLSQALVLFRGGTHKAAAGLSESHGIRAVGWKGILNSLEDLPRLEVQFCDGTFRELAHATENRETLALFDSSLPHTYLTETCGTSALPVGPGSATTLDALWQRIPDLQAVLVESFGFDQPWNCHPVHVFWPPSRVDIDLAYPGFGGHRLAATADDFRRMLGVATVAVAERPRPGIVADYLRSINPTLSLPACPLHVSLPAHTQLDFLINSASLKHARSGDLYVVAPFPGGFRLSQLSMLCLLAYVMGMLVRYHPRTWQKLATGAPGDRAYPMLRSSATWIEENSAALFYEAFMRNPQERFEETERNTKAALEAAQR